MKNYISINLLIDHSLHFPQLQALVGGSFSPAEFEDFRSKQTLCSSLRQLNSKRDQCLISLNNINAFSGKKEMRIKTYVNDLPLQI